MTFDADRQIEGAYLGIRPRSCPECDGRGQLTMARTANRAQFECTECGHEWWDEK